MYFFNWKKECWLFPSNLLKKLLWFMKTIQVSKKWLKENIREVSDMAKFFFHLSVWESHIMLSIDGHFSLSFLLFFLPFYYNKQKIYFLLFFGPRITQKNKGWWCLNWLKDWRLQFVKKRKKLAAFNIGKSVIHLFLSSKTILK